MRRCIFIKSKYFFNQQIKRYLLKGKNNFYLSFGEISPEQKNFLAEKGILEMNLKNSDDDRDKFLKEYVSLIGTVGVEQNHILWWATDIASKNRFTSSFGKILQEFWIAHRAIYFDGYDSLFLINCSWPIENTLRKMLKQIGLVDKLWEMVQNVYYFSKTFFYKLFYCTRTGLKVCWNIFVVHKLLGITIRDRLNKEHAYSVIKSFILQGSFSAQGVYQDNYFGILPQVLASEGPVFILAMVLTGFKENIKSIKNSSGILLVPLEYFLKLRDVWHYARKYFYYYPRIKSQLLFSKVDVADILNKELIRSFCKIQLYQLLHYPAMKRMLKQICLKTFIMTCENNPWERMCIFAIKEVQPLCKILGYSHNVIPQASANMFISYREKGVVPLPDKILTTGEEPKRIMEYYGCYETDFIQSACGLRFQYLLNKPLSERRPIKNILLALEGIEDVRYLIDYALKELRNHPLYQMTIRTHPILPWHYFVKKYHYRIDGCSNIVISYEKSLYEDINNSDVILYWGTTVALEALSMGKPVIHFDNGSLLSYDPLFRCPALRWKVSQQDSLPEIFSQIESLSDEEYICCQSKAKEYIRSYFQEVTPQSLEAFQVKSF